MVGGLPQAELFLLLIQLSLVLLDLLLGLLDLSGKALDFFSDTGEFCFIGF